MNGQLILQGVVGSTAYGLATPESDEDLLGVYQAPTSAFLGFKQPQESVVTHEPQDCTTHEVGKFLKLCLANNPTVMELLWLNEYRVMTDVGRRLLDVREACLSTRVRNTYGGYANQQLERLLRREEAEPGAGFSSDLKKRTEKHGRHCFRLIIQGTNVLRTGELRVRLTPDEVQACREAGKLAASDVVAFGVEVTKAMAYFDTTPTSLPDQPDSAAVEEVLIELRREQWVADSTS